MAATSCEQKTEISFKGSEGKNVGFSGVCLDGISDEGAKGVSEWAAFHWRTQASSHPPWLSLVLLNAERKYKEDIPWVGGGVQRGEGGKSGSGRMAEEAPNPPPPP